MADPRPSQSDTAPDTTGGPGFPRSVRLRRHQDFQHVDRTGRRATTRHLVGLFAPNTLAGPRVGFAVGKKVGGAVVRNRVKRWLREAVRHEQQGLPPVDVVLIARPAAASSSASELRSEVASLVGRIRSSVS